MARRRMVQMEERRRNNIVIEGFEIDYPCESFEGGNEEAYKWKSRDKIGDGLSIQVRTKYMFYKMANHQDKLKVMNNKLRNYKRAPVYINNDLTKDVRET